MTLHIAVVGTGKVAGQNYLPYIAENDDVTLSYWNRTRAKAEAVADKFGGRVADSIDKLMAGDPDTILVLTAEAARYSVTDALLAHQPKRLFFEKPLVAMNGQADVTEDDFLKARELLQRADTLGAETAMVFNYRFFEQTQRTKRIVAERSFGQPVHFTGFVHYACWSHCIDLMLTFLGSAQTITALGGSPGPCMGTDSVSPVTAAVQLADGATGTIVGTCSMDFKLPLYELTFAYEHGRIHMRDLDGDLEVLDYRTGQHEIHALPRDVSRWDQYRTSFGKAINAYLDSIRSGSPPPVPGLAGLSELQFEAGIKRSIATGASVNLDEAFPIHL